MIKKSLLTAKACGRALRYAGFSLIELMIAITLGILISIGLIALFDASSKANRVQQMLSEIQENGRYAVTLINTDLRLASRQLMNMAGFTSTTPGTSGMVNSTLAPNVYLASLPLPEGSVSAPAGWPAGVSRWPLSSAYFMQGNVCTTSACTPNNVPPYIPAMGTAANARVQSADVLTVRYLNSQGWSSYQSEVTIASCAGGSQSITNIALTPVTGNPSNFVDGDLALLTSSSGEMSIFQVSLSAGVLAPENVPSSGTVPCPGAGEVKLFNFSRDFISVTYWLKLVDDLNSTGRVIPVLMRTVADNTGTPGATAKATHSELVQGVEQMNFLYGVQKSDGTVQLLTADKVASNSSAANCPLPPQQYVISIPGTYETAIDGTTKICLWRSAKSVEAHLLVDSINNLFTLSDPERAYQYTFNSTTAAGAGFVSPPSPTTAMTATGIAAGSMIRREFVTMAAVRNYNP